MLHPTEDRASGTSPYCSTPTTPFVIALPEPNLEFSQDEEWCLVRLDDGWQEIRFHDYSELFDVPRLYEYLFYDVLKCQSPDVIRELLASQLRDDGRDTEGLRVLDLGAGNGMVGEALAEEGAGRSSAPTSLTRRPARRVATVPTFTTTTSSPT